jgi:hypothetical protein
MELPNEPVQALLAVLSDCTAHILAGSAKGAGFFFDEHLLLTCNHVVENADVVTVTPMLSGTARNGEVVKRDKKNDLALVKVDQLADDKVQPAVALHRAIEQGQRVYHAAGYPRSDLDPRPGFELIEYEGHPRTDYQDKIDAFLIFDAGTQLTFGMSGGPVLSAASGAVVAVTRWTNDPTLALGGGAVPIAVAASSFEEVRRCLDEPPTLTRRWRDALGSDAWERLGYVWEEWPATIDLYLSGKCSLWRISLKSDDSSGEEITANKLGDEVSEALFQWAQRRRVQGKEEVKLLAKLLSAALFPSAIRQSFATARQADSLLVRLHVSGSELTDIPWEFATVPDAGDEDFLATGSDVAFIRVAQDPGITPDPKPHAGTPPIRVLGVIVQPPTWQKQFKFMGQWPAPDEIGRLLSEKVERHSGRWTGLINKETADVESSAKRDPYEVFHYVGFGKLDMDGAHVAMYEDRQSPPSWQPAQDFFAMAAASKAQVVVVELGNPPLDQDIEPITASAMIKAALAAKLNAALVFTRYPVHPRQWQVFNDGFYMALGDRKTVEMAVQDGRQRLWSNKALGDAAAYGWFTIVSGTAAHTRLAFESVGPEAGVKQKLSGPGTGIELREQGERQDAFSSR